MSLLAFPIVSLHAQLASPFVGPTSGMKNVNDVVAKFTDIGNTFIQILIAFAVIWIIFNVVRFLIVGADSEDKRKQARDAILYGVIGLFVILSIWGLVNILRNTFQFSDDDAPTRNYPQIPLRK